MKPIVFNYSDYEKVVEENKKLKAEVANLQIRCRIAESNNDRDCKNCKHNKPDGCSRWDCEYEPVMSDLISRADAIDTVKELNRKVNDGRENDTICTPDVLRRINALPSADAVEVVRCKDCKHSHMTHDGRCKYCDELDAEGEAWFFEGDFFCAYGERRKP